MFKAKLIGCLGDDADLATWAPDASPPPASATSLPPKLVFIAPVKGGDRMGVKVGEYKAAAEAAAVKAGGDASASAAWPHIQNLGDSLRCTVECFSAAEMLDTWRRVQAEFDVRTIESADGSVTHHGRLKVCAVVFLCANLQHNSEHTRPYSRTRR